MARGSWRRDASEKGGREGYWVDSTGNVALAQIECEYQQYPLEILEDSINTKAPKFSHSTPLHGL